MTFFTVAMGTPDPVFTVRDRHCDGWKATLILSTMALVLWAATTTQAAEFGTREEAKAMLDKAVTAVKENKEKALAMFNNGESGFKDRDLYVLCANGF